LGTALLDRLLHIGRAEKIARISGTILPENAPMKHICAKLGFRLAKDVEEAMIQAGNELSC